MTRHCFGVDKFIHQANLAEQADEYVKGPLDPFQESWPNDAIFRIEYYYNPPHRMTQTIMNHRVFLQCHG